LFNDFDLESDTSCRYDSLTIFVGSEQVRILLNCVLFVHVQNIFNLKKTLLTPQSFAFPLPQENVAMITADASLTYYVLKKRFSDCSMHCAALYPETVCIYRKYQLFIFKWSEGLDMFFYLCLYLILRLVRGSTAAQSLPVISLLQRKQTSQPCLSLTIPFIEKAFWWHGIRKVWVLKSWMPISLKSILSLRRLELQTKMFYNKSLCSTVVKFWKRHRRFSQLTVGFRQGEWRLEQESSEIHWTRVIGWRSDNTDKYVEKAQYITEYR